MNVKKVRKVKGSTLVEKLVVLAGLTVVCLFVAVPTCKCVGGANLEYSDGSRKGTPYKISKKGVIWDTYEGELSLGLTTQDSEGKMVNQIFKFSVSNPQVAKEIEKAMLEEKKVRLDYRQYLLRGYKYGGTSYDVVKVTILD